MINVPEYIKSLIPYSPGKPIEEVARELGVKDVIKLASNENPFGPSPLVTEALSKHIDNINFYPDGEGFNLKRKLGEIHKVEPENIILGNGSNEILELVARTFLSSKEEVVMADQSFIVYGSVVQAVGAKKNLVPLLNFTYDLNRMADAVTDKTKLLFIANPNNPTGTSVGKKEMDLFFEKISDSVLVVIDEAYFGYEERSDFPASIKYYEQGKNVVILRTFSKIYGLAGLRIGYGIAKKEIIEVMNRIRQPFNTSSAAQVAALAALSDDKHIQNCKDNNRVGKKYLCNEFNNMGLQFVPSDANFILVEVGKGKDVFDFLLREGVIVRALDGYNFPAYIRVTIGTPDQNRKFITALKKALL